MSDNSHSDSTRLRIRVAVQDVHAELDAFVVSQEPFATVEAYGSFLWCMRQLYVSLQPAISKVSKQIGLPDCSQDCIAAANQDAPGIAPPASPLTLSHLDDGAWGYAYVMEGSALGATQLVKLARERLPTGTSLEFLSTVSSHAKSRWPIFIREIDERCENVDAAIAAAEEAFNYALKIFTMPTVDHCSKS